MLKRLIVFAIVLGLGLSGLPAFAAPKQFSSKSTKANASTKATASAKEKAPTRAKNEGFYKKLTFGGTTKKK